MKRPYRPFLVVALLLGLLLPVRAATAQASAVGDYQRDTSVGVLAAQKLSEVTGIAISPLLGVGGIGAVKYWRATQEQRPRLSWYAQPWFFIPALLVVGACLAKDVLGTAMPTSLKKPFDVLELFENKFSGLIATGAIIPMVLEVFAAVNPDGASALDYSAAHLATVNLAWLGNLLLVPLALVVYGVVFLVSHTINVLILVSPFTTVDAALKSFRAAMLGTVVGTHWINDYAGAIWAGLIVLACVFLAPWAFRTTVFGTVFAWDILTFRRKRFTPAGQKIWAFSACRFGRVPHRAYGRLERLPEGGLVFAWRPWLVLPVRREPVPEGDYIVGQGVIHSEILRVESGTAPDIFNLPPRFNGHEEFVAATFGLREVRPVGLRAAWTWVKALFTGNPLAT